MFTVDGSLCRLSDKDGVESAGTAQYSALRMTCLEGKTKICGSLGLRMKFTTLFMIFLAHLKN